MKMKTKHLNDPKLTVVLTRYGEADIVAERCLKSLASQQDAEVHVLFLDQKDSGALRELCQTSSNDKVALDYQVIPAKSLSFARNEGVRRAKTELVAFCDTDCTLEPNWAAEIIDTFKNTDASLVGTKIVPHWTRQKRWYHMSKFILEFYSMLDIASKRIPVPKIVGASFALDKSALGNQAYFDEKLGRVNGKLLGGEETDLCYRALKAGHKIYYSPFTFANHWVEAERMNLGWLWKRSFYGGVSRASRGGSAQAFNTKPKTIDYMALALIIAPYALGFGTTKLKRLLA
jgi:GT2 family glycosyltransferase